MRGKAYNWPSNHNLDREFTCGLPIHLFCNIPNFGLYTYRHERINYDDILVIYFDILGWRPHFIWTWWFVLYIGHKPIIDDINMLVGVGRRPWSTWLMRCFVLSEELCSTWVINVVLSEKLWSTWVLTFVLSEKLSSTWVIDVVLSEKLWSTWVFIFMLRVNLWNTWKHKLEVLSISFGASYPWPLYP